MVSISSILFIVLALISIAFTARKSSKARTKIIEQANEDYDNGVSLTAYELQNRLDRANVFYEDLETKYWVHIGALTGFASYLYWDVWYLSVGLCVFLFFIGDMFMSIKPFKSGIPER